MLKVLLLLLQVIDICYKQQQRHMKRSNEHIVVGSGAVGSWLSEEA